MRTETDSLGEMKIPDNVYYGIQTLRALQNFQISGITNHPLLTKAYAILKLACCQANTDLKLLDSKKSKAISKALDEIISGKFDDQFKIDIFQAGAGTSFNMNINEVTANRALEILKKQKGDYKTLNPNDDVNMAQSTNDTFPSAMRIAIILKLHEIYPVIANLSKTFRSKAKTFSKIIKSARTHLQDAVPITLGQEFESYAVTIEKSLTNLKINEQFLYELGIGGSAAGTGINTHPKYAKLVTNNLKKLTKIPFKTSANLIEAMQSQKEINYISGSIKNLAIELNKISNDLRLLASGPKTGFAEIILPSAQPGSSIMPGKVNPSILECMNMICMHVIGADLSVNFAVQNGQLNLNVFMPLMAYEILNSIEILQNGIKMMDEKCIKGTEANKEICEKYAMSSPSIITALNPIIGYTKAAEIVKEALKTGQTIKEIILAKKLLSEKELNRILDPKKLT